MKVVRDLSGILENDEIKRIPAEIVSKIEKYFEEVEGLSSKHNNENLRFYDKLTELTRRDEDKSMELERLRIENATLRKQLEKVQTEVSVLKHSGFTFDEIEVISKSRSQLIGIQSDLKHYFKDFQIKSMDIKSRLAKLCEQFMVKFVDTDFCDGGRGKTLADIHDAMHNISFLYNQWHNTALIEIGGQCQDTETQMTGTIYLIYEKLKAIEEESTHKFDNGSTSGFNGFGSHGVMSFTSMQQPSYKNVNQPPIMMPSQGVTFVNGFNNLQSNFNATKPNYNDNNHQSFTKFISTCPPSIYRGSVPVNAETFGNNDANSSKSPGVIKRPVSQIVHYGSNTNSASTLNSTVSTSSEFCSNGSISPNRQQSEQYSRSRFQSFC